MELELKVESDRIKVGDILYVRTTHEAVFVLKVEANAEQLISIRDSATGTETRFAFSTLVTCRIPIQTRDGIVHNTKVFYAEELETIDDWSRLIANHELKDFKMRQQLVEDGLAKETAADMPTVASKNLAIN